MELSSIVNETMNITCADTSIEAKNLAKLVEELQQKLHEAKQQLQRTQLLKEELEHEVDKLECQNNATREAFDAEKEEIIISWTDRLSKLQTVIEEERAKSSADYNELERKYEELKNRGVPSADVSADYSAIHDELKTNEVEIMQLKSDLLASKDAVCELECTKEQLCKRIHDLEKELEENKEFLKCKSESLQSTLKALEEMKDEKALLANELAVLKAGPIDDMGRGNSLFSEVDDKRQNLEKKFATLHNKYLESKKILALKGAELEKLKRENIKFQLLWEEGETQLRSKEEKLVQSYNETIKELRHRVKELEALPESPQIVTISDKNLSNMQWIHTVVDQARSEVRELRRALEAKSMETLFGEENTYLLTAEVTHLKRKYMKDQALIEDLKMKLAAFEKSELLQETSPDQEKPVEKENKPTNGTGKTLKFADDVKENDGGVPLKKKEVKKKGSRPPLSSNIVHYID